MRQAVIFLAAIFTVASCLAQQYPFVHYTPKDGLISNQVRNIYQDSKGRLYFSSINGLSIYDGSRFSNYNSKNGLAFDIVNCVMEMGDDSVWIVTNTTKINCLVRGQLKTLVLKDTSIPIINQLIKDDKGILYAATDQGLFLLDKDRFLKLPFTDINGNDINTFIARIYSFGDHLLVQRDNSTLPDPRKPLYLYNKLSRKITAEAENIVAVAVAPDRRIWVSTEKNILCVDTAGLRTGKISIHELPDKLKKLKNMGGYFVFFDREGNGWLGNQRSVLIKASPDGNITSFTTSSGLSMFFVQHIFQDREGIIWIAMDNAGVSKLVRSDFSFFEQPFAISAISDIAYDQNKGRLLLYSGISGKVALVNSKQQVLHYKINNSGEITRLIETPNGVFGISANNIYKMVLKDGNLSPHFFFYDSTGFSSSLVDKHGNLVICGKYQLKAIVNGSIICHAKLNLFADHATVDSKGNIWVATREQELVMFEPQPGNPFKYLLQKKVYTKELSGFSPRSIIVDKYDNIWIGTRNHGIHVFSQQQGSLQEKFVLNYGSGLSDNFIQQLSCDAENNIWASSASGLDKIIVKKGLPVIENLTRQNNIYQRVLKTVVDKENTVWGLLSNGLIKITRRKKSNFNYTPTLMIGLLKAGKDTVRALEGVEFSYKQNNLSFYLSATSFLDEKNIQYSYRLQGGANTQWSEPSNNGSVSFVDLNPGHYILFIKVNFPAGSYPEQIMQYAFSIAPPWWQTWWFRTTAVLLFIGLLILTFRFYYNRRLYKQMAALEKKQAIAKERTRIATDMHDDLGAGLSRVKFLSQSLTNKQIEDEQTRVSLEKITGYSDEMTEKMGEIVWALNEKNDTLADLVAYTRSYAMEYLANHSIQCEANTPLHLPGTFIAGEIRRNIFLSVKECLHNIVKHANAGRVNFSVELNSGIRIIIHDNGKGIDWNNQRAHSNGLENIQRRMKEMNGLASFVNEQGTKVILDIPLPV